MAVCQGSRQKAGIVLKAGLNGRENGMYRAENCCRATG